MWCGCGSRSPRCSRDLPAGFVGYDRRSFGALLSKCSTFVNEKVTGTPKAPLAQGGFDGGFVDRAGACASGRRRRGLRECLDRRGKQQLVSIERRSWGRVEPHPCPSDIPSPRGRSLRLLRREGKESTEIAVHGPTSQPANSKRPSP